MRTLLSLLAALLVPPVCAQEPSPPPEPEVFEVIPFSPELIGGMVGLHRRVQAPPGEPVSGEALITFIVDERGEVQEARAVECNVTRPWCEAAIHAVEESQFIPGSPRGRPVKYRVTLPVVFPPPGSLSRSAELAARTTTTQILETRPILIGGAAELQQRAILPPEAFGQGVGGRVRVGVTVGTDGIGRDLSISRGIGRDLSISRGIDRDGLTPVQQEAARWIERNALDAVAGSRFVPGTRDGEAFPMRLTLYIDFGSHD